MQILSFLIVELFAQADECWRKVIANLVLLFVLFLLIDHGCSSCGCVQFVQQVLGQPLNPGVAVIAKYVDVGNLVFKQDDLGHYKLAKDEKLCAPDDG
jgi:hypothetical protein